ncbi:MAG: bifunctional riboflavin kinase/FAD synthetase, partial [Dehalococcoidia bacterium]|nr:bifunctional riboflavin kinase/FAD synthetase [Dehalococcoidia bacterium]
MSVGAPPETIHHLRAMLRASAVGRPAVVVIGKFDGVHLGHAALLRAALARAHARDAALGVITFDPLPYVVFNPGKPFHYLCSLDERVARLRDLGAAFVAVVPFSRAIAEVSAEQFVAVLQDELRMVELVIGPGAVVGHNREGDATRLRALGAQRGFTVTEIAPVTDDGRVISSSQVRHALWDGDVQAATQALGRYYTLDGVVQHGDKRGRELGYPTANLLP